MLMAAPSRKKRPMNGLMNIDMIANPNIIPTFIHSANRIMFSAHAINTWIHSAEKSTEKPMRPPLTPNTIVKLLCASCEGCSVSKCFR